MASQSRPSGSDRQELFEAFHRALTDLRRGVHMDALAEQLLRRDRGAEIVALIDGGERAVVFEPGARRVVAERFDANGFGEPEVLWSRTSDPTAWLDANRQAVDWVRPAYRWVLEMAGEQSAWDYWLGKYGLLQRGP